jgi:mercuric ion transport protein
VQFSSKSSLIAGALAAVGASVCCVGPLVLLAVGVSGTWMASLTAMEPFRPWFIGLTFVFLGLAFRKLYLAKPACVLGEACANLSNLKRQRITFWVVTSLLLGLLSVPWFAPLFY